MRIPTVTCEVRYKLDLTKQNEFQAYALAWVRLIERYGGSHHGYFLPRKAPVGAQISFPQVGHDGPSDVAIALFTFPDEQSYLEYRRRVVNDPECKAAEALYLDTRCFVSYERLFLERIDSEWTA